MNQEETVELAKKIQQYAKSLGAEHSIIMITSQNAEFWATAYGGNLLVFDGLLRKGGEIIRKLGNISENEENLFKDPADWWKKGKTDENA